jgi:flagellar biosynthesis protein FliR
MSLADLGTFETYFIVLCRVGGCLMLTPGYASPHIPVQARLFLAIAVSASITPLITGSIGPVTRITAVTGIAALIAAECLTGALLGTLARILFSAIHFAAAFVTQLAGYSGMAAADDGTGETVPELGAPLSAAVLVLMFILDFHADVIKALIESYSALPVALMIDPGDALDKLGSAAAEGLRLSVRIATPFIVISVLINMALGFVNKVAPQVPVYFISGPFLAAAALLVMFSHGAELAMLFSGRFLNLTGR